MCKDNKIIISIFQKFKMNKETDSESCDEYDSYEEGTNFEQEIIFLILPYLSEDDLDNLKYGRVKLNQSQRNFISLLSHLEVGLT